MEPGRALERSMAGDREKLERAAASYSTYLMFMAQRVKGPHLQTQEGASDLVQRTLVTVLGLIRDDDKQVPHGSDEEFKAWLVGVMKNTYKHMVRHYNTKKRSPVPLPDPRSTPSPSALAMLNEELQNRSRALDPSKPATARYSAGGMGMG